MTGILVTTSRRPTPRIRSLVKDLASILPRAEKFTRGHYSMVELSVEARLRGADKVVVVGGKRGNPSIIRIYKVTDEGLENTVSFIVKGVALSRELKRPLPEMSPSRIIVETDGNQISDEFADAFIKAFDAKVFERPRETDIVAVLAAESDSVVRVEFRFRGSPVGPRLRLAKPRRMVKGEPEE